VVTGLWERVVGKLLGMKVAVGASSSSSGDTKPVVPKWKSQSTKSQGHKGRPIKLVDEPEGRQAITMEDKARMSEEIERQLTEKEAKVKEGQTDRLKEKEKDNAEQLSDENSRGDDKQQTMKGKKTPSKKRENDVGKQAGRRKSANSGKTTSSGHSKRKETKKVKEGKKRTESKKIRRQDESDSDNDDDGKSDEDESSSEEESEDEDNEEESEREDDRRRRHRSRQKRQSIVLQTSLPQIDKYDGSTEISGWLRLYETRMEGIGMDDKDKLRLVGNYMTDTVARWLYDLKEKSWKRVKEKLRSKYGDIEDIDEDSEEDGKVAMIKVVERKQKEEETITQY
jgi:hypothetical protein